jgi:hypothetical protein
LSLVEQRGRHDLVVVSADGSSVVVSDDLTLPLATLYYAAKLQALPEHDQWWLPRFVAWLVEVANKAAHSLGW